MDEIEVVRPEGHTKDIVLSKDMTLRMKYPSLSQFVSNNFDTNDDPDVFVDKTFKLVVNYGYCLHKRGGMGFKRLHIR